MSHTFSHGDGDYLSDAQLAQLLKGINPVRVAKDPKGNSHVEAYEIRAHLNRIFGPLRWDEEVLEQAMVYEDSYDTGKTDKNDQPIRRWGICWRSIVRLTLRSPSGKTLAVYTEGATCDATNQPSRADAHDQALKGSASQALKRCATNLGDQFGLGLYNKGSLRPLVQRTLVWDAPESEPAASPDAHITTPLAPESAPESGESARETTSPPASKAPPAAPVVEPERPDYGPVSEVAESEAPVGPTAPDAGGGSPAVSGESASSLAEALDDRCPVCAGTGLVDKPGPDGETITVNCPECGNDDHVDVREPAAEADPTVSPSALATPAEPTAAASSTPDRGPTPGNGSEPTAEDSGVEDAIDAWERIVATVSVIRMSPPEEALQVLNGLMETAAQHRLATRRYPDTDKALSIILTEHMRDARAAIERRRAAVQS